MCYCTPASPTGSSGESGEGGDFHSHCILIQAFYNFSLSLTIDEQIVWEEWIQMMENEVLSNSSLSSDQKVVLISLSLKVFFSAHVEIYNKLCYKQIAGWGALIDFMYVSISIQLEITQSIVTVDGDGNCDLTDAINNASANGSPQEQAACNGLVVKIQAILLDLTYTYEQKLAVVWELCQEFSMDHPDLEAFLLSIHIQGYGSLASFLEVCHTYKRITTLESVIGGNSTSDCPLLEALEMASQNSSFNVSVQAQFKQLKMKLQLFFQTTVDISLRLEFISSNCHQQFLLAPFMVSFVKSVRCKDWGTIYDIIFCSGICTNYGCGNPNDGPGPQVGSTSVAPSSVASTGSSASSVGTTPKPSADCASVSTLITINMTVVGGSPCNCTHLTNTLLKAYNGWTSSQRLGANSCMNKVRKAIWDDVSFPTPQLKLKEIQADFWAYNNNSVANQKLIFDLTIEAWGVGTIRDFVGCVH